MKIIQALNNGYNILKSNNIYSYKIDADLLLSESLKISKEELILNLDRILNSDDYSSDINTIGLISVGSEESAYLDFLGDSDWFKVSLVSGQFIDNISILLIISSKFFQKVASTVSSI